MNRFFHVSLPEVKLKRDVEVEPCKGPSHSFGVIDRIFQFVASCRIVRVPNNEGEFRARSSIRARRDNAPEVEFHGW